MLAWHYTTARKYQHISASGMLIPGGIGIDIESTGMPVLWFSRNQHWEQTAGDACHVAGQPVRRLTMRETYAASGGLVRYGCDVKRLDVGEILRRKAQITHEVWAALYAAGKQQQAYPAAWCGSVDSIPVDGLVVDVLSESFKWERFEAP
ncbi:hypothetical protein [Paraburkholderia saeva]|uniref:Uncharacterized protein n=1 Tax=Paraburkholderia saeva TaxID=2777537 RepID=A0A9N8S045_9BURK|nr:hypothetical protein [Paraburkholderia saeva]CAG4889443.1 hypothetical protein R70241_00746 [Paraburkholderia saeva]CAG4904393.1 hypothetical protein R52603_03198 [Paraburkholderia saeva]CAG4915379.1 hypothetical protein LMG31841_04471 [Paraburkholderia saeva]